jgi:hypothetical protein
MKCLKAMLAIGSLVLLGSGAQATTYNDATGDTFFGGILDIASVEVTDNSTSLFFTINLNASISNPNDWGNYMIGIDIGAGGDTATPVGNPWNRPISMGAAGMDFWLGSWVNSGGGSQLWSYTGSWNNLSSAGVTIGAQSVTITAPLASLGLSPGSTFNFDVYSSGADGNPGAVDSLSNPDQTISDWGNAYANGPVSQYTITAVPEPSAFALIGLGAIMLSRGWLRRQR